MRKSFQQLLEERIASAYGGSAAEFARATGFTPQTVSAWRKGRVTLPQIATRRRLARELGVSHVELLVSMGELDEDEVNAPEDPRSDAVRRLQPLIDRIRWNEGFYRLAEQNLRFIRDAQRGAFPETTPSWEMEDTSGIGVTEFGEGGEITRRQKPSDPST